MFLTVPSLAWGAANDDVEYVRILSHTFKPRKAPAKIASDDAKTLEKGGYFQLGSLSAFYPTKDGGEKEAPRTLQEMLLKEAASRGGDVVVIEAENVPKMKARYKRGACKELHDTVMTRPTYRRDCLPDAQGHEKCTDVYTGNAEYHLRICSEWEQVPLPGVPGLTTTATVWRHLETEDRRELDGELPNAASSGQLDLAKVLLQWGAAVEAYDGLGRTALQEAVAHHNIEMVKLLLDHGADPNSENPQFTRGERKCGKTLCEGGKRSPQAFKIASGTPADRYFRAGIFDLFSLCWREHVTNLAPPWPTDLNIGRVLMVGAGSVGSGAAYCMRLARLAGHLAIIDKDEVKIENLNRSPIFGRATFGIMKSQAVAQFLAHSPLTPERFPFWWNEFVETRGCRRFDVWLPLANEFNVRLSMQSNCPPLMIHASTSVNWGVNHGRHIPGRDDCLADRFPTEVKRDDLTCATGQVTTPNQEAVDAALPFASLFAGLLITADLVRAQLPVYPQVANFALFDWYGARDAIQAWDRKPRPGCMCREQTRKIHARLNGGTRHWPMFGFVER